MVNQRVLLFPYTVSHFTHMVAVAVAESQSSISKASAELSCLINLMSSPFVLAWLKLKFTEFNLTKTGKSTIIWEMFAPDAVVLSVTFAECVHAAH